jgi:hypothetical protein
MPRICQKCRLAPREDDPLRTMEVPGLGMASICRDCQGLEPRIWPEGIHKDLPTIGEGLQQRLIRLCGICRLSLRESEPEGDVHSLIRLKAEDIARLPWLRHHIEAGVGYAACEDCQRKIKPVMYPRLVAAGIIRPTRQACGTCAGSGAKPGSKVELPAELFSPNLTAEEVREVIRAVPPPPACETCGGSGIAGMEIPAWDRLEYKVYC